MRPTRIFLDVDDVLNSLTMSLMGDVFGCKVGPYEYESFPVHVGYDIIAAVAAVNQDTPIDQTEFWQQIPCHIWANVPISYECDRLLRQAASLVGREEVYLATAQIDCAEARIGKIEWINQYLPKWIRRQYFITPQKWLLGKPGAILIDDCDANCDWFEKEGGQAIIMPRPWNRLYAKSGGPMDYVLAQLTCLFGDEHV